LIAPGLLCPPASAATGQGSFGIAAVLQGADPPEPYAGPQPEGIGKAGIPKPAMRGRAAERAFRRPGKRKASIREQTSGRRRTILGWAVSDEAGCICSKSAASNPLIYSASL